MTLIKKKSLVVALVSSFVIGIVLVLTIVGYLAYIEIRQEQLKGTYEELLCKVKARAYARHIEVSGLEAKIETDGALKGKPIVEGTIKNTGNKHITDLILKIKFLDRNGSLIYEMLSSPQDPALANHALGHISIPYVYMPAKNILKSGDSIMFKQIITNCPHELWAGLQRGSGPANNATPRWPIRIDHEVLSLDY